MDADTSKTLAAFGFLTILESPEHGWFGGYLVLSPLGRPLEFRCSTPVSPTRAQEILYGASLRPYLFAELIGQSLLAGSELPVSTILTDQPDMLLLAVMRGEEVLLVDAPSPAAANESVDSGRSVAGQALGATCELNQCRVTAAPTSPLDEARLRALLEPLAGNVFLLEPFDRIRAALAEMQTTADHGAECEDGRSAA
jgi:hypothetical protein